MPGYLERYGAGEEKRERLLRWTAVSLVTLLLVGGGAYLFFRNFFEVRRAELFLELLRKQDYASAYALWGCGDPGSSCQSYTMEKFLEDWGPKGLHANASALKITHTRGCSTGVIVEAEYGADQPELLWVDRKTKNLGFAPWPVCNPRMPKQ